MGYLPRASKYNWGPHGPKLYSKRNKLKYVAVLKFSNKPRPGQLLKFMTIMLSYLQPHYRSHWPCLLHPPFSPSYTFPSPPPTPSPSPLSLQHPLYTIIFPSPPYTFPFPSPSPSLHLPLYPPPYTLPFSPSLSLYPPSLLTSSLLCVCKKCADRVMGVSLEVHNCLLDRVTEPNCIALNYYTEC